LFYLYQLAVFLSLPVLRLGCFFNPKLKLRWIGQKNSLAELEALNRKENQKCIWFHCASLGEFEQARPLIEALKKEKQHHFLAVTFFSPSGYEIQKNYPLANWVGYLPWDQRKEMNRFLTLLKPDVALLVKYELWPNLLTLLKQQHRATFSLCGRFYDKQFFFKPYGKWLLKRIKKMDGYMVVDEASKNLLKKHEMKPLVQVGDLRMDRVLTGMKKKESLDQIETFLDQKKCFVVGSSWPEDYPVFLDLLLSKTDIKLIIAPHDVSPKSIAQLEGLIMSEKAYWSRFNPKKDVHKKVLIMDVVGYLAQAYQYAHWAYVGGGMGTKGLHNILEAVVYGIPVFIGKNYRNFKEAGDLVQQGGVLSVSNKVAFGDAFETLSPKKRIEIESINKNYVEQHSGATQKCLAFLAPYL